MTAEISEQTQASYSFISTQKEGNQIIANLTERFKDGQSLLDQGDLQTYISLYVVSVLSFYITFRLVRYMLASLKVPQYMQRGEQDRVFYLTQILSNVHNWVVAPYALYLMYYSCQSELGYPSPSPSDKGGSFTPTGEYWGWWRSEVCMMEFNKGYAYNMMISSGFMTVEFFIIQFLIPKPTILNKQMKMHHIMTVSCYTLSLVAGYSFPGLCNASLLCEISSVFLNYKDMFTKESRNSAIGQVNQLCFFIAFTLFRVILFPYLVYKSVILGLIAIHLLSAVRAAAMIYCIVQGVGLVLLNYYWFGLILKGIKRLLQVNGVIKGGGDYADLDKYEACASTTLVKKENKNDDDNNSEVGETMETMESPRSNGQQGDLIDLDDPCQMTTECEGGVFEDMDWDMDLDDNYFKFEPNSQVPLFLY